MQYIDEGYYLDTFLGLQPQNPDDLKREIARACDTIDILTSNKFLTGEIDFNTLNPFIKTQVQKATAALVEHYILNGGYDALKQSKNISNANLGGFSYSNNEIQEVPEHVFLLMHNTGLLYMGIAGVN